MIRLKHLVRIGSVLMVSITALILLGGAASAALPPDGGAVHNLELTAQDDGGTGTRVLTARLTSGDEPLGNRPIEFYVTADFLGERPVKLSSVTSDENGYATFTYDPRWQGTHVITARSSQHPEAEATLTIEFTGTITPHESKPIGLETIRNVAPKMLPLIVLAVWGLLAFVIFRTVRGMARAH